jgi:hypothetical protein
MPVRYREVSNSWKPSSPKLNTLSTMTCACFFMASIWPARSAFMAASFSGSMVDCPDRAREPRETQGQTRLSTRRKGGALGQAGQSLD